MIQTNQIEWQQAQTISATISAEQLEKQKVAQLEFIDSDCSLFDAKDLLYYLNETGKDINWLLQNGKNINPLLSEPLVAGHTLDELMHIDINANDEVDLFKLYNVHVF